MSEASRFLTAVQNVLTTFLLDQDSTLSDLGEHPLTMLDAARSFTASGKRFRAQFAYWGWRSTAAEPDDPDRDDSGLATLGAALEMFHAAALVHDDIIDRSDTRRGRPSTHRQFGLLHREQGWRRDPERFGEAAAILLGDLLTMWSDELLSTSISSVRADAAQRVRTEFNRMRTQVTAGQYLDLVSEVAVTRSAADALTEAERVITYKSAKYSVESPLALGALLAGGDAAQVAALRSYGLPLGLAFQLRDDLLGVFGDPEQTGKPNGDDLREGKRTVLVALARRQSDAATRALIDDRLGDPDMDDATVSVLQSALVDSGAVAELEERIARLAAQAGRALEALRTDQAVLDALTGLTTTVTQRSS